MKALIIDDDRELRAIARLALAEVAGWTVATAASGAEGVALAGSERPDVILLDVMMPTMDGPATLQALRGDPGAAQVPVIFLTGRSGPQERLQLLALGAQGVIAKPFDVLGLAAAVGALLGRP